MILILFLGCQSDKVDTAIEKPIPVQTAPVVLQKIAQPIYTGGRLASPSEMKLSFKIGGIVLFLQQFYQRQSSTILHIKRSAILGKNTELSIQYLFIPVRVLPPLNQLPVLLDRLLKRHKFVLPMLDHIVRRTRGGLGSDNQKQAP